MKQMLLVLLMILIVTPCVMTDTYYIKPTQSTPCPVEGTFIPCLTVSQVAVKSSNFFAPNTSLVLLPGNHNLEMPLMIRNVTNLLILTNSTADITSVNCSHSAVFTFENIGNVHIFGLSLIHCAVNITLTHQFTMEDCDLVNPQHNGTGLLLKYVTSATIMNLKFTTTTTKAGNLIKINNSVVSIVNSSFSESNLKSHCSMIYIHKSIALLMSNTFSNNRANRSSIVQIDGKSIVLLSETTFDNNTCLEGNQGCAVDSIGSVLSINNSVFVDNTVHGEHSRGGALSSLFSVVNINNCNFVNNSAGFCGGAVCAQISTVSINNSIFSSNRADYGGAVRIDVSTSTVVVNSNFFNNTADDGGGMSVLYSKIMLENITFFQCRGRGGAMQLQDSNVTVVHSRFIENEALLNSFGRIDAAKGNLLIAGGAMFIVRCTVTIQNSSFVRNSAEAGKEALLHSLAAVNNLTEVKTTVLTRFDVYAGAIFISLSSLTVDNSKYVQNEAVVYCQFNISSSCRSAGGGIVALHSFVEIKNSEMMRNRAIVNCEMANDNSNIIQDLKFSGTISVEGGAIDTINSTLSIYSINFAHNEANITCYFNVTQLAKEIGFGGAVMFLSGTITIHHSTFHNNTAEQGGAIAASYCRIKIDDNSKFTNNRASKDGGAVWYSAFTGDNEGTVKQSLTITLGNTTFDNNSARYEGGAMLFSSAAFVSNGYLYFTNNAGYSVVTAQNSVVTFNGHTTFVNNTGSALYATVSNVTFEGYTNIMHTNGSPIRYEKSTFAPLYFIQSELTFTGNVNIMYNKGYAGGAIYVTEGRITMHGEIQIRNNTASLSGGAIYAYKCELAFRQNCVISENRAYVDGGGVYAASSTMSLFQGSLKIHKNSASKKGGGIYLANSKLYVIKSIVECKHSDKSIICSDDIFDLCYPCNPNPNTWIRLDFVENFAEHGGALYVADDTYSDNCVPISQFNPKTSECFIQNFVIYVTNLNFFGDDAANFLNIHFYNNTATIAGNTIFGGLLDRCFLSRFTEVAKYLSDHGQDPPDMPAYQILAHYNITSLQTNEMQEELSSLPVRVCFCRDDQLDCDYQPTTMYIRKGEHFTVSAVAVDQVMNTVSNSSIHSIVSAKGGLGEGQSIQKTGEGCTELEYSIFSPHDSEQVFLYAEGPCEDRGISKTSFDVSFVHCPIGFKDSETTCECDPAIFPNYTTNCSIDSEKVFRKDNVWIDYVNTSEYSGFLLHHHCPFDYCVPGNWINLNVHNGTDDQCAFNRTGKLCGSCKDGLSLLLGTSQCMPCSNDWLGFLFLFVMIGIALVAFLLVCNFTVDVGTINGFILYANIVTTNTAILIPFKMPNILSVFIAWLNLDFGFETCFFDGMDGYAKTWLQFVFPLYTILLVITIMVVVEHSKRLTGLLRIINKNPVATLATLILLSYTKLLRTIITALSYTKVQYQYGSDERVWLMDANIQYLKGRHLFIFIAALLFLIIGLMYTSVLLFWQWIFKWVRNTRLFAFMDAYQNPYNPKHRYWSGLLLLVRLVLYLVSALNVTGDPSVNILSIICVVGSLLLLKEFISIKIYKEWTLNVLESSIIFNVLIFVAATSYARETHSQSILAYISVSIVFATFLGVLAYHTYTFVVLKLLNQVRNCSLTSTIQGLLRNTRSNDSPDSEFNLMFDNSEAATCTEIDASPPIRNTDEEDRVVAEHVYSTNSEHSNVDMKYYTEMKEFCGDERRQIEQSVDQDSYEHNDEDHTDRYDDDKTKDEEESLLPVV